MINRCEKQLLNMKRKIAKLSFELFFTGILLGVGLAMDAFSVSLANGLKEPCMKYPKMCIVAATFAFFQALMPMIGWTLIHSVVQYFQSLEKWIPWIALALLTYIGISMILESRKEVPCEERTMQKLGLGALLIQGIATSIDALSVGVTIADRGLWEALLTAAIIAVVTFVICLGGILIGKSVGTRLAGRAGIFGGAILIFIGLEIFITSWF